MNKLGIIIGRCQPLHNGHVELIKQALQENTKVLLLLGSVNKEVDFKNPFTYDERVTMIRNVFPTETYEELLVRGLCDRPTDDEWVAEVIANIEKVEEDPSKVTLYTSEKDEEYYRSDFLYQVVSKDSQGLSATDIRGLMYGCTKETEYPMVPIVNHKFIKDFTLETSTCAILGDEEIMCLNGKQEALKSHKFSNPIEPVAHAAVVHDGSLLVVRRASVRGHGQLALPGGFVEHTESTREAAVRELREETGVDLTQVRSKELAQSVEENLDDLSVRTLGVNYLYLLDPNEDKPEVTIDPEECLEYQWIPLADVLQERTILFYNHNVVVQRLMSIVGGSSNE